MAEIDGIKIPDLQKEFEKVLQEAKGKKEYPSFKETIMKYLKEVNQLQKKADSMIEKFIAGEASIEDVVIAAQEANISFRLLMEIRNKILDAYREFMKMRV